MLFNRPAQTQQQTIFETPATLGEYLSAERASSFEESDTRRLVKYLNLPTTGEKLSKEQAQEAINNAGVSINNVPDNLTSDMLASIIQRQKYLDDLNRTKQRRPDGYVSYALGTGAMLGPQIVDPIGMALNFVPLVGTARYANMVGKSTTMLGRTATRFGLSGAEAAGANLLVEPARYAMANALGDDYTAYDTFMNTAFGFGFGGTLGAGAGAIGDAFGAKFGGVASPVPREEVNKIKVAAAQRLMRDGVVDVQPLLNAATKQRLLYDLNEIQTVPGLKQKLDEQGPGSIGLEKARAEYLRINPEIANRLDVLNSQLKDVVADKNVYQAALKQYEAGNKVATDLLEQQYGKGFRQEANDYLTYVSKQEKLSSANKRQAKILKRDADALDAKYEGRFSKTYEASKTVPSNDIAYNKLRQDLDRLEADVNLNSQLKLLELKDSAQREYMQQKEDFASGVDDSARQRLASQVDNIDEEIDAYLSNKEEVEDEILSLKASSDDFEKRTGFILEKINDKDYDVTNVVSSLENYLKCIRR